MAFMQYQLPQPHAFPNIACIMAPIGANQEDYPPSSCIEDHGTVDSTLGYLGGRVM
jgi:hypothetical protein